MRSENEVAFAADNDPLTDVSSALQAAGGRGGSVIRKQKPSPGGPVGIGDALGVKVGAPKSSRPRVRIRDPRIEVRGGQIDERKLRRRLFRRHRRLKACFEREIKTSPEIKSGLLITAVNVTEAGRPESVSLVETTLTPTMVQCMITTIRAIRFPQPKTEKASFTIALTFTKS